MRRKILLLRVSAELLRLSALLDALACYVVLEGVGQGIYPSVPGLIFAVLFALLFAVRAQASAILDDLGDAAREELERRRSLGGLEPRDWRRVG